MRNFRQLTVWNQGIELAVRGYELVKRLPTEEKYGLKSQITKALVSIPSNIAEGCSRKSDKDFARFLEISLGSAYEVETDLIIVEKIGYIDSKTITEYLKQLQSQQRQITSFINRFA
ncbi:MAG TPA: four helix bundle protein [Chryseosolibacter sp.]